VTAGGHFCYCPRVSDLVQISKTLSLWLRHRPDVAGLELDSGGWAPIDAVLAALALKRMDVSWDRLLEVVELNDKQRFELSGDASRIRARQGHSIPVQGHWPEAAPPDVLFHGTVARFLPAIIKEGLKPMRRHHVHLSGDEDSARRVAARRGPPVVLRIAAGPLAAEGGVFHLTENNVWLIAHVPPAFIRQL
jgi:putative RNA 2'-phosphotransferase